MNTPIIEFVHRYAKSSAIRMHMPGHKGTEFLGLEPYDITEINGADVLYTPEGIIAESEHNATELFGTAHTFYSTEGSSLSIKAMLALAAFDGIPPRNKRMRPLVLAARNVHKSFVYACALLDINAEFISPTQAASHICQSPITANDIAIALADKKTLPCAVYVTSPDYLGNILDIKGIAEICHQYGVPLLVDNAHGAYLALTEPSMHPIALGADMCCDSAHKTLPALTGAGYLHISKNAEPKFIQYARARLSLFASTSPSYLILQSLDMCNKYIAEEGKQRLNRFLTQVDELKYYLTDKGFTLVGIEPLKVTLDLSENEVTGNLVAEYLRLHFGIECEYSDSNYIVFMLSPQNTPKELDRLQTALLSVPQKNEPSRTPPVPRRVKRACTIRQAILAPHATLPLSQAVGRICASPTVSCPPAIPIAISGEIISEETTKILRYYGINEIDVVIEQ